MLAMLLVAPKCPSDIEHFTLHAVVRVNYAPIPNEGTDWTGEVGQLLHGLSCRGRLEKMTSRSEAIAPAQLPRAKYRALPQRVSAVRDWSSCP